MRSRSAPAGSPLVVVGGGPLSRFLVRNLGRARGDGLLFAGPAAELPLQRSARAAIYVAAERPGADGDGLPDPRDAEAVFTWLAYRRVAHTVLLSSAAVCGPSHHHPGLVAEGSPPRLRWRQPVAGRWRRLEKAVSAAHRAGGGGKLTILRPPLVPMPGGRDIGSRLLAGRHVLVPAGRDPSLQVLSPEDLLAALRLLLARGEGGVYHVAPRGAAPLRAILRAARLRRWPLPATICRLLARLRRRPPPAGEIDYVSFPWTIGDRRLRRLGYRPTRSSLQAVRELKGLPDGEPQSHDPYGMDRGYIDAFGRRLFRFLHDAWWRIELDGLEHVPPSGRGVLVGLHRGFQPWDAVMLLHALARRLNRYPRFLIHPTLVKFPFLANYITKLGGLHACVDNADWVLGRDHLLGVFPEGIRGAFSSYRDAYELKRFGRGDYVRMALRNRAPILPFVTVGSAEIFPILAKLDWGWFRRWSEWPCLPITPTMGLVPLPSKWHTRFLEPLHVERQYGPEAADDPAVVRAINGQVKSRIRHALDIMLASRRSVFYGRIFKEQPA